MTERGRPRLFTDAETFAQAASDYFVQCAETGKMPTLAGLSLSMGFDDRESFSNYANYGEEYSRTVKRARLMIEDDRNQRLANPACTGVIFDLKNNHGWKDKTEQELTGANGGPVRVDVNSLSEDQLRALASIPVQRG